MQLKILDTEVLFAITKIERIEEGNSEHYCPCYTRLYVRNRFFCYDRDIGLYYSELVMLRDKLHDLLQDKIPKDERLDFIEIISEFLLQPKTSPNGLGPFLDWELNLPSVDGVYSIGSYIFTLNRREIGLLLDYINDVLENCTEKISGSSS